MFERHIRSGRLTQPFATTVTLGSYCLTVLKERRMTLASRILLGWMRGASLNAEQRSSMIHGELHTASSRAATALPT